jgi:transcriptional regulator with XRE-family HTH domain
MQEKKKGKPDDLDREIAKEILRLRKAAGITQKTLAEKIGVTFQQVQKYESGINRVSGSVLFRLCDFFKIENPRQLIS